MTQYVLMNPGPINVSPTVRRALAEGEDLCHRESEYFDLQDRVREKLLTAFGLSPEEWAAVLVTGSGTCVLEAAVVSSLPTGGTMLVVVNGVYGDRIAKMATAHGIEHERVETGWLEPPDLALIEERLTEGRFDVLAAVHHETTTGMLNPVEALGEMAARHGAAFLVDTISGLGGETFDFGAIRPTLAVCTANKCVEGLPGVSFVLVRRDHLDRMTGVPPRSLYLWLPGYFAAQENRSTPFTPAIQVTEALEAALDGLIEESVRGRIARYAEASRILRDGFESLGLELLLPPERRSNTITGLRLPPGIDYDRLHDALKARGYVVYAGPGKLREDTFRISNMGQIPREALEAFAGHLRSALEEVG
jgi:2-aminoethylphosphonate-pyruvate transaminase